MMKQINTISDPVMPQLKINSLEISNLNSDLNSGLVKGRVMELESVDYVTAQAQLAKTMRRVCENNAPIAIDGMGKDKVVLMPLEHFQKLTQKTS